jgi:polyisoprenoid-binding protein YceI
MVKMGSMDHALSAGAWTADPNSSTIEFTVKHNLVGSFRSGFGVVSASLIGGHPPRLEGEVEVASIDVADAQLKAHLLGPDFFDAGRYPELKFGSTEFALSEDGVVRVVGELHICGQRRLVSAVGNLRATGSLTLSLEAAIDRRDFGISFQMQLPKGGDALDYEVRVLVHLVLVERD